MFKSTCFLSFDKGNLGPDRLPYKYASRIQELVPNSTLLTIEDGGHDLTISHPSLVSEALIKFFRTPSFLHALHDEQLL